MQLECELATFARYTGDRWQHYRRSSSKVGRWEREQLEKTAPQPKGNFLMELTGLPFHGSDPRESKIR